MEGPSLFLAAEQLAPFIGQKIQKVEGNSKIGKERLENLIVCDIFSWGKHLVFQFNHFALRVHFMLFGSFTATVDEKKVTGDYEKKNRQPRLALTFKNGHIEMYSCSLRFIEEEDAKQSYDFSIDIMSKEWDSKQAFQAIQHLEREIGDVLLDQSLFSGVGNIIKNEVLFIEKISPETKVNALTAVQQKKLIKTTHKYVSQFYEWRKQFVLRKHFQIYRKSECPKCHNKIMRIKTGLSKRWSYFCPICQR